jgi:hypothetical protein
MVAHADSWRGPGVFGPAYRAMFEAEPHPPGSVDRVLIEEMVLLGEKTRPRLYPPKRPEPPRYEPGSRPGLEGLVRDATVAAISRFGRSLGASVPDGIEELVLGGTEEQIVARGSDWCTDVARVACALCQVEGIPARTVFLADVEAAYSGHAIVEAFHEGAWGAFDPLLDVVYRSAEGRPASVFDLACGPAGPITPQFRAAAIAEYPIAEASRHSYPVVEPNAYLRSILERSVRGWPGGLRWLHGEDRVSG